MTVKNGKIIHKKLSYEIIGACFDVFNSLGPGLRESTYQKAISQVLKDKKISFNEQLYIPIKINGKLIDKHFIDFLIEDKVIAEVKVGDHFYRRDIEQLLSYLKLKNFKLGLMVNFTHKGVKYKRILNIDS